MRLLWTCVVGFVFLCGCGSADTADTSGEGTTDDGVLASAEILLCGGCGQIKGSDVCCDETAEKCSKCDLAKGSPGCCVIAAGDDVALCEKCGVVAGDDACCDETAEKCEKCGLIAGSPGCCNI